jgi:sulfane dehydrogenase subunit SoxC
MAAGGTALVAASGAKALLAADATQLPSAPADSPPAVPPWSKTPGKGISALPYGMPSRYEKDVVRRYVSWFTPSDLSSTNFTPLHALDGIVTPNGLCFSRCHNGVPDIDPAAHRLMIHGMVERPLLLTMDELRRFPATSRMLFIECAANSSMEWKGSLMAGVQYTHGMLSCCEYTGVKLSVLMAEVGVTPEARWMLAEGADAALMDRSIPIAKAREDAIVAWAQNGERLRPENGYPLRLLLPGWQGNMNIKWLRRLKFGDQPWETREETSKYTDLMPDGKARQFTWVMEAKSVITRPSPEQPLTDEGFHEISGLAWSGRGKIARVDVSLDGGINWQNAALAAPVLPQCLTRFRLPWRWTGDEALLQSRAMDETGYVQPTIAALRAVRGSNSGYHNNAIQTWRVNPSGEVENVQLD